MKKVYECCSCLLERIILFDDRGFARIRRKFPLTSTTPLQKSLSEENFMFENQRVERTWNKSATSVSPELKFSLKKLLFNIFQFKHWPTQSWLLNILLIVCSDDGTAAWDPCRHCQPWTKKVMSDRLLSKVNLKRK